YGARVRQARANVLTQIANLHNSTQAENSGEANEAGQDAAIAAADAQLGRTQADWNRLEPLVKDGWATRAAEDQARAGLPQAQAQVRQAHASRETARQGTRSVVVGRDGLSAAVEAARAQANSAEIDFGHTVIRAPEGGTLSEVGAHVGQYV